MIFVFVLLIPLAAAAQGTGFNFQGRLNDGSNPANGSYDLQFRLYDAIAGGTQIGALAARPNTTLINGVFSVTLDFGATAFNNPGSVFIEIAVKPNGSPNAYTILGPRQQLTVVPFAVRAANATNADNATNAQNSVNATNATNATTAANSLSLGGVAAGNYLQTNGNGSQLTNVNAVSLGGVAANQYPTLTSNEFIQNKTAVFGTFPQEANLYVRRGSFVDGLTVGGNLVQTLPGNGVVKASALVRVVRNCPIVQPFCTTLTPTFVYCYNSMTNTTGGNCGFSFANPARDGVDVNFGFPVIDRFISLTSGAGATGAAVRSFPNTTTVSILNGLDTTSEFYIFIF